MNSPRVGAVLRPEVPPEHVSHIARAADDAGLGELWLWEDCFFAGGLSAAAIALSSSSRMTVGVGVFPAPMRNVATVAMEIAALHRAFPGRVRIGIGHGVQDWMAQIGARVSSPLTLLREYLTGLRALLDGERVSASGTYVHLDGVQLAWPAEPGVEILCGATGPKTLRLSGELADGTILTSGHTPDSVRRATEHIAEGRARRGSSSPHSVVAYVRCEVGGAGQTARREAMASTDATVRGTADDVARHARSWVDAGADTIVLQPEPSTDAAEFVATIGAEVQPLIASAPR